MLGVSSLLVSSTDLIFTSGHRWLGDDHNTLDGLHRVSTNTVPDIAAGTKEKTELDARGLARQALKRESVTSKLQLDLHQQIEVVSIAGAVCTGKITEIQSTSPAPVKIKFDDGEEGYFSVTRSGADFPPYIHGILDGKVHARCE